MGRARQLGPFEARMIVAPTCPGGYGDWRYGEWRYGEWRYDTTGKLWIDTEAMRWQSVELKTERNFFIPGRSIKQIATPLETRDLAAGTMPDRARNGLGLFKLSASVRCSR